MATYKQWPMPDIGVVGFTGDEQVRGVLAALPENLDRKIVFGVSVSPANRLAESPRNIPKGLPSREAIGKIFVKHPRALNLVDIYDTGRQHLTGQMITAQSFGGEHCDGLRLGIPFPDPRALQGFHDATFNRHTIVLQCSAKALSDEKWLPEHIAWRISEYEGLIGQVLLPKEGPHTRSDGLIDVDFITRCFEAISKKTPRIGFGVSVDLAPEKLDLLYPILKRFPYFSVNARGFFYDAEGKPDISLVVKYLKRATVLMNEHRRSTIG